MSARHQPTLETAIACWPICRHDPLIGPRGKLGSRRPNHAFGVCGGQYAGKNVRGTSPSKGIAMYLVAATAQREALALPRPGPLRPIAAQTQPVGVRHAVATAFVGGPELAALCGANIHGWLVFSAVTFATGHAAACQRCAQLVTAATSANQRMRLEALRSTAMLG